VISNEKANAVQLSAALLADLSFLRQQTGFFAQIKKFRSAQESPLLASMTP
jgi:hypothetical protein